MLSFQTVSPAVVQFELFPAAERNIAAFERLLTPNGVTDDIGWGFVDWGYVRNQGEVDVAVNMHFLAAVRDMVRWCQALGDPGNGDRYANLATRLVSNLSAWFDHAFPGPDVWEGMRRAGNMRANSERRVIPRPAGLLCGFFALQCNSQALFSRRQGRIR